MACSGRQINWLLLIELLGQMSNDPMFLCELIFGFGWQNGTNKNSLPPL